MHEDLGMSDAPWRDQQQHPLGKNLCHFYNELQPKDTSCVWMCVNLCKHSAHFKMNGLFTLKDLLEKKVTRHMPVVQEVPTSLFG